MPEVSPLKVSRIGARGFLMSFPELDGTNTYVVEGERFRFFLDTYLGPDPMREVEKCMRHTHGEKTPVVFNSHADWDHIWGNPVFRHTIILAHESCRERVIEEGPSDLERHRTYVRGDVTLVPPNVVFSTRLDFPDERLHFFHTPGHTQDSSSCFDEADNVLFAGDNVESPLPCVSWPDLDAYIASLQSYLALRPDVVIPGHGDVADLGLVRKNLEYLMALSGDRDPGLEDPGSLARHGSNLQALGRA
ncbi:MAG: MBL fold metallo-hydrolase [Bacillota bacterium]|jgi:glyoxylase-like metal-dependent hydrolase (beta-lactamase superfamily II)|nr:MBL fold metallo-hydrolase [Bacillota bacterium]